MAKPSQVVKRDKKLIQIVIERGNHCRNMFIKALKKLKQTFKKDCSFMSRMIQK